jgi:pimeloyl-ACP methyl ester carboxylesterase
MTHSTHKEELHVGTARGLHHLAGRLRAAEGWPGWWGLEGPEYLASIGQLVLIPGVGHVIDIEAATRFNTEVKAFLRAQGQDARG